MPELEDRWYRASSHSTFSWRVAILKERTRLGKLRGSAKLRRGEGPIAYGLWRGLMNRDSYEDMNEMILGTVFRFLLIL